MDRLLESLYTREFPEHLFHYTSLDSLLGIVDSRSLWVSGIRYLNDTEEIHEFYNTLSIIDYQKYSDRENQEIHSQLINWLNMRETMGPLIFVGSFSEKGNLLSQWRAYTSYGKGVSICFNTQNLISWTKKQNFTLGKCIYDNNKKNELAKILKARIIENAKLNGPSDKHHISQSYFDSFNEAEHDILTITALIKNDSFVEESEWRLVSPVFDNYVKSPILYRDGENMLIPYLEFKLHASDKHDQTIFEKVTLGPTPDHNLSVNSLSNFLSKAGACNAVGVSGIPYRPT